MNFFVRRELCFLTIFVTDMLLVKRQSIYFFGRRESCFSYILVKYILLSSGTGLLTFSVGAINISRLYSCQVFCRVVPCPIIIWSARVMFRALFRSVYAEGRA